MRKDHTQKQIREHSAIRRLSGLLLSIFLIWVFMFIIGPKLQKVPIVQPLFAFIEEHDIDAGAYYYTEIEEFSEADVHMNNTMTYPTR